MPKGDKYFELEQYLKSCNKYTVYLSFEQIEHILGFSLPTSAKKYIAWWANDLSHSQANSWINAGYKTKYCDFNNNTVSFQCTILHRPDYKENLCLKKEGVQ